MTLPWSPEDLSLLALLSLAVFTDLKSRRIPNSLTFGFTGLAVAMAGYSGELPFALLGAAVALVPGFVLWMLGGAIRAGDAKLLMAVGALTGPLEVLRIYLLVFLVSIPVAIVQLAVSGRLRTFFGVIAAGVKRDPNGPKPMQTPFAAVIALAVALARVFPGFLSPW